MTINLLSNFLEGRTAASKQVNTFHHHQSFCQSSSRHHFHLHPSFTHSTAVIFHYPTYPIQKSFSTLTTLHLQPQQNIHKQLPPDLKNILFFLRAEQSLFTHPYVSRAIQQDSCDVVLNLQGTYQGIKFYKIFSFVPHIQQTLNRERSRANLLSYL